MIDHVHGEIIDAKPELIRDNPRLRNSKNEEKRHSYDKGFTLFETYENPLVTFTIVNRRRVFFSFSLHQFYNQGKNDNDFYMESIKDALDQFSRLYDVPLSLAQIHGIELGVNILPPLETLKVIKRISNYKGKPFTKAVKSDDYDFLFCDRQRFTIKIYDKGKQYEHQSNMLRYEIRIKKMSKIVDSDIISLDDLAVPEKIACLGKMLFKTFSKIEIKPENIDLLRIKKRDLEFIEKAGESGQIDHLIPEQIDHL